MNSLPLSHVVISWLTRFYLENRYLQILPNTVAINSYLGLSVLSNFFFFGLYINLTREATLSQNISLKFSECRNSIRKQIRPCCRKTYLPTSFCVCLVSEKQRNQRFERIFEGRSKCSGKELPPWSNFHSNHKTKIFALHRKAQVRVQRYSVTQDL